jgi:hypothetical protein
MVDHGDLVLHDRAELLREQPDLLAASYLGVCR